MSIRFVSNSFETHISKEYNIKLKLSETKLHCAVEQIRINCTKQLFHSISATLLVFERDNE